MNKPLLLSIISLLVVITATAPAESVESAIQRGRVAAREMGTPVAVTTSAYTNIWKRWGLTAPPADFRDAVRERYGLHFEPKAEYPLGIVEKKGLIGSSLEQSCLLCHAGTIADQTIIGLGNATLDYHGLIKDLSAGSGVPLVLPYKLSQARGTIEAGASITFLLQFRNHDLTVRKEAGDYLICDELYEDIPPWWNLKYKKTENYAGSADVREVRARLGFFLSPIHSSDFIKQHETPMRDIKEYLFTLEPPKYPFPIDAHLARRGEKVFRRNCARCHGTYGDDAKYPNKVIPVEKVGTDATLLNYYEQLYERTEEREAYTNSWLFSERGPDGKSYHGLNRGGYQAPPLHGVWATAPYFHNGSVPTIYHVLNSETRPSIYQPSFDLTADGYDQERLGLKFAELEKTPPDDVPLYERRKVTDTTKMGRGNQGHRFGDKLNDQQRTALVEYLKTL